MAETASILHVLDVVVLRLITPLAVIILISGIDDLWIYGAWLFLRTKRVLPDACAPAMAAGERRIAIFVPLWHEHEVILDMLAHNIGCLGIVTK